MNLPPVPPVLPAFDRPDYIDRGYYIVSQFQDEKRRRDRADAVRLARLHPGYLCLMTPDNRLLHRNVYSRDQVHLFLELYTLVATWTSPEFFVMGYPITASPMLEGLNCFGRMGKTCNPPLYDATPVGTYLGCPRASITLKYMHPRSWYTLYVPTRRDPKLFVKVLDPLIDAAAHDLDPAAAEQAFQRGLGELRKINQQYCGCPLVHLRRVEDAYCNRLPATLRAGEGIWTIGRDAVGQVGLQPRNKALYEAFLASIGLNDLPYSTPPTQPPPPAPSPPTTAPNNDTPKPRASSSWLDD